MPETHEQLERELVIKEARSWVGTKFVHAGRVSGDSDSQCLARQHFKSYACCFSGGIALACRPRWHMSASASGGTRGQFLEKAGHCLPPLWA